MNGQLNEDQLEEGAVTDDDRMCGHPFPCKWCGWAWGVHRGSDGLCPATREDGSCSRGAWEKDGATGTRYRPDDPDEDWSYITWSTCCKQARELDQPALLLFMQRCFERERERHMIPDEALKASAPAP